MIKPEDAVQKIFNSLSLPVLLINRDYVVVEANRAAIEHLGLSPGEVVGHTCFRVTHQFDHPCWNMEDISCPVNKAFATGKQAHSIHQHNIQGKIIVEELVATPLEDGTGKVNFVVEEFRDVTELLDLKEGYLPICASCKKIRDMSGDWHQIEAYIRDHTGADFSHTFCPECFDQFIENDSTAND